MLVNILYDWHEGRVLLIRDDCAGERRRWVHRKIDLWKARIFLIPCRELNL
jgi:hypothetical protein